MGKLGLRGIRVQWGPVLTLQGLALHQVQVVGLLQDAALEAPAQTLQISIIDVEHKARAVHLDDTHTRRGAGWKLKR